MIAFRAIFETKTVAIHLWYRHQDRAYSHLQTTSPAGYQVRAAYALYAYGLDCLAADCAVAAGSVW